MAIRKRVGVTNLNLKIRIPLMKKVIIGKIVKVVENADMVIPVPDGYTADVENSRWINLDGILTDTMLFFMVATEDPVV